MVDAEDLRSGEADEDLFVAIYPVVRQIAAAVAPPGTDADDLIQDALVRTLARGSLSDLEYPIAYLARAVLNLALKARRGYHRTCVAIAAKNARILWALMAGGGKYQLRPA